MQHVPWAYASAMCQHGEDIGSRRSRRDSQPESQRREAQTLDRRFVEGTRPHEWEHRGNGHRRKDPKYHPGSKLGGVRLRHDLIDRAADCTRSRLDQHRTAQPKQQSHRDNQKLANCKRLEPYHENLIGAFLRHQALCNE